MTPGGPVLRRVFFCHFLEPLFCLRGSWSPLESFFWVVFPCAVVRLCWSHTTHTFDNGLGMLPSAWVGRSCFRGEYPSRLLEKSCFLPLGPGAVLGIRMHIALLFRLISALESDFSFVFSRCCRHTSVQQMIEHVLYRDTDTVPRQRLTKAC